MRQVKHTHTLIALGAVTALAACGGSPDGVSRSPFSAFGGGSGIAAPAGQALASETPDGTQSEIIAGLLTRRSILPQGPYTQVSDAVLAANARAAEADLRAATLRAEARSRNWLPTLGPQVSLTSLGAVVTSLVVEQVIFDNGRKRAERDYAKADVEVAAVALSQDTNDRVLDALTLYLNAGMAEARAQVNADAMADMEHFAWIMDERVKGGVSSTVDRMVVQQKLNQMQADMASDLEAAAAARAELAAMSAAPLDGVAGIAMLPDELAAEPLAVVKAEAEAARTVAEAKAARAGFLPGITAVGNVTEDGSGAGLTAQADQGIGFGTGAALAAAAQQAEAADARVAQTREDVARSLRALEGELASLRRQEAQTGTLAAGADENYANFAAQQKAGQRGVTDVVGVFETAVGLRREAAALPYRVAQVELKIAALRGVLVDGDKI
ncbi:outer membrane protein, adhesin transport system [Loktanella fryxellensis]|uniref:Outer membrane protein, adhesin transport system n=1 Tax=Loktanella fryxellensis TaxID=245187 RepID=A0A1H8BRR4_9RHOB|nr:TolC family protein [Loktanella fryxellensis]SEM84577.1 outer membrane protein, adhesin transport system [Loktanella fryxellensis]